MADEKHLQDIALRAVLSGTQASNATTTFNNDILGPYATVNNVNNTYDVAKSLPSRVNVRELLYARYTDEIDAHVMFGMEELHGVQFKDVFLKPHVAVWDPKNEEPNSVRLKGQPFDLWANLKKRTTIWAKAGAGKTSLCQWIAYEWSRGNLPADIDWVIYIDLPEAVKGIVENESFVSMLHRYWDVSLETARDFIRRVENCLVVFDGLDEARALVDGESKFLKNVCDPKWKELIGMSGVLLAGRPPEKAGDVGRGWKQQLEVIGFGEQEREKYVMRMFQGNESEGLALLEQIRDNQVIADLASVPLQLQLICALRLNGIKEEASQFRCAADLLTLAIDEFLFRGMQAADPTDLQFDLKDAMMERLLDLSKLDSLVLNAEDEELLGRCGVIYQVKHDTGSVGRRQRAKVDWRWYHESFRDYFRALRSVNFAATLVTNGQWAIAIAFHESMLGASVSCYMMAMWLAKQNNVFDGCFLGWLISLEREEIQKGGLFLSLELEGWNKVDVIIADELRNPSLDETILFGHAWHTLSLIYKFVGNFERSLEQFKSCCEFQLETLGSEHSDYVLTLREVANALHLTGRDSEALERFDIVCAAGLKVWGEEHPDYLHGLRNIADIYERMGQYQEALDRYKATSVVQLKVLGKENPDYLTSLHSIALVYEKMGKYQEALNRHEAVRIVQLKVLGEDHHEYLDTLHNIALIYESMGNYDLALTLYEKVQIADLKALGKDHPDYITTLCNVAGVHEILGNYREAADIYERVRQTEMRVLGRNHPSSLRTLYYIAGLLISTGDYAGALERYEIVLAGQLRALGEANPHYLLTMAKVAYVRSLILKSRKMLARTDYVEILERLEHVQQLQHTVLGDEHPFYLRTLYYIVCAHESRRSFEEAFEQCEIIESVQLRCLGTHHSVYLSTRSKMADLHLARGNCQAALEIYETVRDGRLKFCKNEEHPEYLETLHDIASVYLLMNQPHLGLPKLEQCVSVALRIGHRDVAEWSAELESARENQIV